MHKVNAALSLGAMIPIAGMAVKVAEVKDQFRQLGTPPFELAGVNMSRIEDTGTSPNPKPSNSSKPPAKDRPAEGTKGAVKTDYDKMKERVQERYKKFAEDKKQNIPQTSDKLLPNELKHGHFGKLPNEKADDITGHHMPSNKYMQEEFGIDTKESYAMFLEHPHSGKGGRHRRTFTYGLNPKSRKKDFDLYMSLKPRDALAFDINDARRILKQKREDF
ncbi:hypothetical protein FC756_19210 [Lysinibacillus mangiferihumi]|uniref:Uncharacterized protein n=1 Tax=Lysinibacillus mangiferihumi TaxID=1130819 RepID=A0A4U2YLT7_9BACI|nr:hypothetical protein [Lysinibacillus mangiferihumi]TKI62138.1 hypothetical protein FC756_19210 [Lysinibacillus mangiferihumi]